MKKIYTKPLISVEAMTLDQPIAANCSADVADMQSLIELGYFGANDRGVACGLYILEDDTVDMDGDKVGDFDFDDDTICYHSNVQTPFLS